jgi:hypothetical protein
MSEQVERRALREQNVSIPAKCTKCRFLDKEFNPLSGDTHLYCRAPLLHPKRWSCTLPTGMMRA